MSPPSDVLLFLIITAGLTYAAYRVRLLDLWGSLAAILTGVVVFLGGGWTWFISLVYFFAITSFFTRFKYEYKHSLGFAEEKGGARGWRNVVANGGFASFFGFAGLLTGGDIFTVAFLGSVATATGDTLATEIGLLSRTQPRLLLSPFRKAQRGESGAVTLIGLVAGLFGVASLTLLAISIGVVFPNSFTLLVALIIGGFLGTLGDSAIGSRFQWRGRCTVCQSMTEAKKHHGSPTVMVRGIRIIDNNVVNLLSTASGGLIASLIYLIV